MKTPKTGFVAIWLNFGCVLQTAHVEENPLEDTFIASAQSLTQQELLEKHQLDVPLYVEGGFLEYLKYKSVTYFVLRGDADPEKFADYTPKVDEKKEDKDEGTVKFQSFRTPENFALICLKLKQRGQTYGCFVKKMHIERQTVKTLIRLLPCLPRHVCPKNFGSLRGLSQ